jgi:hypothetical protein
MNTREWGHVRARSFAAPRRGHCRRRRLGESRLLQLRCCFTPTPLLWSTTWGWCSSSLSLRRRCSKRDPPWWRLASGPQAISTLSAALGGIVVPAAIYATLVAMGKPVGILVLSMASRLVGARLPVGLRTEDLILVGIVASIEFMVWLFFATAAFPGGDALAQTKMGALLSFVAPLALMTSRFIRRGAARQRPREPRRLATE